LAAKYFSLILLLALLQIKSMVTKQVPNCAVSNASLLDSDVLEVIPYVGGK
jgi:hypothetical protein